MKRTFTENMDDLEVLNRLQTLIKTRKNSSEEESYTSGLFQKGQDHILKKLGEESYEVVMASKDNDREHIIRELADLWFHSLVVMAYHNVSIGDVALELERREGVSGLEEKASRKE
jgi:phosphoribosyl-ATP pyrophosphohydrolase